MVTCKYVLVVMRADNHGEGGMMALGALARGATRGRGKWAWLTIMLGLAGAGTIFWRQCDHAGHLGDVVGGRFATGHVFPQTVGPSDFRRHPD